jgi:hypothetical protein
VPLYGKAVTFSVNQFTELREDGTQESLAFMSRSGQQITFRIGYDLFQEVRLLLTVGQPAANAGTAALELHIALLRDLITRSGMPLVEIPPVPEGYRFMTCLTHDLDQPLLRNHCCDQTMFGFLYRSTAGSLIHFCRRRKTARDLCLNLAAAGKLPFVYLGIARDPWAGFDRYLEIEACLGSTYFVIPKRDYAGRQADRGRAARRASRYTVGEIRPQLEKIISAGCEVALHGLDAWLDSASAAEERQALLQTLGPTEVGVRMHWLLFAEESPVLLDRAGFSYDSTFGYNETVGYRAGTTQAYRPIGAANLLELPLHVMDTALFFPEYLNLSNAGAEKLVWRLIDDMERFGGALTINWHDRSIAPERLWEDFYLKLLRELRTRQAWFPTATQAVAWFRKRRAAVVDCVRVEGGTIRIRGRSDTTDTLPDLKIRIHKPRTRTFGDSVASGAAPEFVDVRLSHTTELNIAI